MQFTQDTQKPAPSQLRTPTGGTAAVAAEKQNTNETFVCSGFAAALQHGAEGFAPAAETLFSAAPSEGGADRWSFGSAGNLSRHIHLVKLLSEAFFAVLNEFSLIRKRTGYCRII